MLLNVATEGQRMAENLASLSDDRIAYLEGLVRRGRTAAAVFTQYSQQDVDRIVKAMVLAGLGQAQYLARLAVEETGLGVLEDKRRSGGAVGRPWSCPLRRSPRPRLAGCSALQSGCFR